MKGVAISYSVDGHSFTELELNFWEEWKRTGLVMPVPEYRFNRGKSQHRFDFAWPDKKLAVECEGGVFSGGGHTRGSGYVKNLIKYNLAIELGYFVLRYHQVNADMILQIMRVYEALP